MLGGLFDRLEISGDENAVNMWNSRQVPWQALSTFSEPAVQVVSFYCRCSAFPGDSLRRLPTAFSRFYTGRTLNIVVTAVSHYTSWWSTTLIRQNGKSSLSLPLCCRISGHALDFVPTSEPTLASFQQPSRGSLARTLNISGDCCPSSLFSLIEATLIRQKTINRRYLYRYAVGPFQYAHGLCTRIKPTLACFTNMDRFPRSFKHSLEQSLHRNSLNICSSTPPRLQWSHLARVCHRSPRIDPRHLTHNIFYVSTASSLSHILQFCHWEDGCSNFQFLRSFPSTAVNLPTRSNTDV
jgi:hypothetical protein